MVDLLVFLVVCQEGLWYFTAYFLANLPSAVLTLYQFQYFWEVFCCCLFCLYCLDNFKINMTCMIKHIFNVLLL